MSWAEIAACLPWHRAAPLPSGAEYPKGKAVGNTVHADGSMTIDNASVQRLMDYGLLHYTDEGVFVGRWPNTNTSLAAEEEPRKVVRDSCPYVLPPEMRGQQCPNCDCAEGKSGTLTTPD
jgi:hypothetical protein